MVLYQYLRPITTPVVEVTGTSTKTPPVVEVTGTSTKTPPVVEVTGTSTKTPAPDTRENLYPQKFRY